MIPVVVAINTLIALINFYIAWRVWKLRQILARAANAILTAERGTHNVLYNAPNAISKGQKGVSVLRERYQVLEIQIQRVQQIIGLLALLGKVWQKPRSQMAKQSKFLKKVAKLPIERGQS